MALTIPQPLLKGDTIGFISPSSGPAKLALHRVDKAKEMLEKLGYKVKIAPHALQSKGYVSGTIDERIDDIHNMFLDSEVKMIMCITGGNNSNQLIKHLDYDLIKNHPKIFIGYSDITVLHYALYSQANLATYYGPCAMTQFGEHPKILDYTLCYFEYELAKDKKKKEYFIEASKTWTEEFLDWFKKKDLERARKMEPNAGYEWLVEGKAEGFLLGGAILSVNHLAGTKYWCDPNGAIFFLDILKEDGILNEGAIDALLVDLDNMGVFDVIAGLVISRPASYSIEETQRLKEMIKSYFVNKKCPILFNINLGHTDPIVTLRFGRRAHLDSTKNEFKIL